MRCGGIQCWKIHPKIVSPRFAAQPTTITVTAYIHIYVILWHLELHRKYPSDIFGDIFQQCGASQAAAVKLCHRMTLLNGLVAAELPPKHVLLLVWPSGYR